MHVMNVDVALNLYIFTGGTLGLFYSTEEMMNRKNPFFFWETFLLIFVYISLPYLYKQLCLLRVMFNTH